jgi:heme-degrading monooxygenase HmoA
MFIAMNRFRVAKGSEAAFENVWLSRDSHLEKVPGFVEFHLLKGPEAEDHTLYASHTVWKNRATFEAWTKSEAFRAAHASAGSNKPLYLGHPQFERACSNRKGQQGGGGMTATSKRSVLSVFGNGLISHQHTFPHGPFEGRTYPITRRPA